MRLIILFFGFLFLSTQFNSAYAQTPSYEVLSYHDVQDSVDGNLEIETTRISTQHLARHFTWLQEHGYHPITIDDILAAQTGKKALPSKAILLTFDDGYSSFYTHVYPLLKLYNYPAVAALVGSWLDARLEQNVKYGDENISRKQFLTHAQIKEMAQSGLVEFSSHSYDLHKAVLQNPYNGTAPAAITHAYLTQEKRYETDSEYQNRIRQDLKRNSEFIQNITGKAPRVMTWPYGRYNATTLAIAKSIGMPITFSLDNNTDAPNNLSDTSEINRYLIDANPNEQALINLLSKQESLQAQRIVHVDLDYVYDSNETQMWKNLDALIERIKTLAPTAVYLQAFADPDGNGTADALYFTNRHLPVRADIFSRVARQLNTRANVQVYAWLPVLAFELPNVSTKPYLYVRNIKNNANPDSYHRLSPFSVEASQIVNEIYADLGAHAIFQGVIFHDDATLNDDEDDSDAARQAYVQAALPNSVALILQNSTAKKRWIALKTKKLTDFTLTLAQTLRQSQPTLKTARNLYANAMLKPESEAWLAQNYRNFLLSYDYTAVMAMPKMEQIQAPSAWFENLVFIAKKTPYGLQKTIFEIQSTDWQTKKSIPSAIMAEQFALLLESGASHIGYYPDDFIHNQPEIEQIRPYLSAREFPYLPK